MKKYFIGFLVLIIFVFFGYVLFGNGIYNYINKDYDILNTDDYNGVNINQLDQYNIDLIFYPEEKYCTVKQEVSYINKEDITLNKIFFHVYPNAFRENRMFIGDKKVEDQDYIPGYIEFTSIKTNDSNLKYNILESDQTILEVELDQELKPGDRVNLIMNYKLVIPKIEHRFGYGSNTFNFGNWYPIAVVYDEYGWNTKKYFQIGDPFYSDVSNYRIKIEAPESYIIASSGKIVDTKNENNKTEWIIEGNLIRDFAWVASDKFNVETHNLKDTQIKLYFLNDNSDLKKYTENIAVEAVNVFNNVFGQYPYGYLSIVENDFLGGGMEYPSLVYLNTDYFNPNRKTYLSEYIVHEIAHQWWYGVVGNNQIKDPWLDEGLSTYSQIIFNDEYRGDRYADNVFRILMNNYQVNSNTKEYTASIEDFNTWKEYSSSAYGKGAEFLYIIEKEYGEDKLYELLKTYYNKYRFKNAETKDFLELYETVLN